MQKVINARGKSVLLIGDLHLPYAHKDHLKFLKAVKKEFLDSNSIIIQIGDEVDYHACSMHDSIQELYSAGHELEKAIFHLKELARVFPRVHVLDSNHGSLLFRNARKHGIPVKAFKSLPTLYRTPDWTWHDEIILKTKHEYDTYVCHGKSAVYNRLSKEMGMNAIQGHFHGKFEITWSRSVIGARYNAFTSCLIDADSLAFEYGKNHLPKPIHGCLMIGKDGQPHMIKMVLNKKGRWNGKLSRI